MDLAPNWNCLLGPERFGVPEVEAEGSVAGARECVLHAHLKMQARVVPSKGEQAGHSPGPWEVYCLWPTSLRSGCLSQVEVTGVDVPSKACALDEPSCYDARRFPSEKVSITVSARRTVWPKAGTIAKDSHSTGCTKT